MATKAAADAPPDRQTSELALRRTLFGKSVSARYVVEGAKGPNVSLPPRFYVMVWCAECSKTGVKSENEFTKPQDGKATFIRFGSRLAPLANSILRKRYIENSSVKQVLAWLTEQDAGCSRETYQTVVRQLLRHVPDAQALELGIELPVLHAIRVRLRLPLHGRKPWRMPYHRGRRPQS